KTVDLLDPFDADVFLREYWQRRPCLIPNWLLPDAIDLDGLIELASNHDLPSRLIRGRQDQANWTLRHGPLVRADLPASASDWTVLVQEVDKVCPSVAALLDAFSFLPDWLFDDIMISHAVDGGSVGAHVDAYDVFLVQALGQRRWQLAERFDPAIDDRFELALLRHWRPETELTASQGEALYLPAGVAHHGRALGPCQTWSVGVRTPSGPELLFHIAEHLAETTAGQERLGVGCPDRDRPALITGAVLAETRQLMQRCIALEDARLAPLLGEFLSGWRQWPQDPPEIGVDEIIERLADGETLELAGGARLALTTATGSVALHVNGETLDCPNELADDLASRRSLDARWVDYPDAVEILLETGALQPPTV
ncbi:MAG: cupin domain-containing protein, partial [Wenzhouxiangella sp.]|nr:cupin domain-containing protein [Wenzhouxiangella sp.]